MRSFVLFLTFCSASCLASVLSVGSAVESSGNLGYSGETEMIGPGADACSDGELIYHHDGVCDDGVCWQFGGIVPPYYGAFGEAYDLGAGTIFCGAYWVVQIGYYAGHPSDLYVWDDGVESTPGSVIGLVTGHVFDNVPYWPACGQNDIEMEICVDGPFTVGLWADFSDEPCQYYVARDLNGPAGMPWTNIAPGIGYPTGWHHPNLIWDHTQSLLIGVYFAEGGTPVESVTWGTVKALFE